MCNSLEYVWMMDFDDKIDISDPCYPRDGHSNIIDYKIKPGRYGCYIKYGKPEEYEENRIAEISIIKKGYGGTNDMIWNEVGTIGVDSGLAGFFNHKIEYTDEEWDDFCDRLGEEAKWWLNFDNGFFSRSGWGDGGYYVYESRNNDNEVIALKIVFIEYDEE